MSRLKYHRLWREKHREQSRQYFRKWYKKTRLEVLTKIGKGQLACNRCGFDDYDGLEVNHRNGGGRKEHRNPSTGGVNFYRAIANGKRTTKDLELLCRPCNLVHAAEMLGGRTYKVIRVQ
jgi:hypothetical protein